MNSGLSDAPCPVLTSNFFGFKSDESGTKANNIKRFLTKKSVGGFLPVSLEIVRFYI